MDEIECQCGRITGERCLGTCAEEDAVEIEWVPPYLRGTAEACGSWRGLSERLVLDPDCAEALAGYGTDGPSLDPWIREALDAEEQATEEREEADAQALASLASVMRSRR